MKGRIQRAITIQEAMEIMGLPRHALERAVREGHLQRFYPYEKSRGVRWYFLEAELERWQQERSNGGQ